VEPTLPHCRAAVHASEKQYVEESTIEDGWLLVAVENLLNVSGDGIPDDFQ
jgi:hypothetical protein